MKTEDWNEFCNIMRRMQVMRGVDIIGHAELQTYFDALKMFTLEQIAAGADQALQNDEFFPPPARMRMWITAGRPTRRQIGGYFGISPEEQVAVAEMRINFALRFPGLAAALWGENCKSQMPGIKGDATMITTKNCEKDSSTLTEEEKGAARAAYERLVDHIMGQTSHR